MSSIQPITTTSGNGAFVSLRAALNGGAGFAEPALPPGTTPAAADSYKALKGRIHLKLLEKFDLAALETLTPDALRQEIATMVERLLG
ncbi:MAG TPA: hypothetical protein VGF26_19785, partial [Ramlibacter sp.]